MKITVILCTYNRSPSLAKALDSVAASTMPISVAWEVLVVDNNSSDQTREVVGGFCRRHPDRFRYLFEPQQGKSYALNAGIREARGDVLAFIDDDVTVEPSWLQNLTAALDGDQWAGAGGRILPPQDVSFPDWLAVEGPYSMAGLLVLFDRGPKSGELTVPPFGANMAFRKAMFEKYGGFRIDLGPPPASLRGEDTEFCERLMRMGERMRYEPAAVVHHEIPDSRLKREYFLSWWFGHGRALVQLRGKQPHLWGIPRHYLSIPRMVSTQLSVLSLRWLLTLNPLRRFYLKSLVWMTAGEIVEICCGAYRESSKGAKRLA
jgi:glucosyl-dolichyl phosphate glucuronosyltransferase